MSAADDVAHAQRYRRWDVTSLITQLEDWVGYEVFPNPVTGHLVVIDGNGVWQAVLEPQR